MADGDIRLQFSAEGAAEAAAEVRRLRAAVKGLDAGAGTRSAASGLGGVVSAASATSGTASGTNVAKAASDAGKAAGAALDQTARKTRLARELMVGLREDFALIGRAAAAAGRTCAGAIAGVAAAIAKAISGAATLAAKFASLGAAAGAAFAGAGIKRAFDWGAEASRAGKAMGTTAQDAMILKQAFREAGATALSLETTVAKLQRKVAEGSEAFGLLGLSAGELEGLGAVEQFRKLGEAVRNTASQEAKALALMRLFEEQGPRLMSFFENPEALSNASKTLGSGADVLAKNAAAFERASVLIGNIGVKVQTFFAGLAEGVVTPLSRALEAFNAYDLAAVGRDFGESVEFAAEVFRRAFDAGRIGEAIELGATVGGAALIDGAIQAGRELLSFAARAADVVGGVVRNLGERIGEQVGTELGTLYLLLTEGEKAAAEARRDAVRYTAKRRGASGAAAEGDPWARTKAAMQELRNFSVDLGMADWKPTRARESREAPSAPRGDGARFDVPKVGAAAIATDALARVGGYIGGSNSPAATAEKETAKNTKLANSLLTRIHTALKNQRSAAVFA